LKKTIENIKDEDNILLDMGSTTTAISSLISD
jgi:DeoR/GlpR family transcriptional regulator of sugar metabolism